MHPSTNTSGEYYVRASAIDRRRCGARRRGVKMQHIRANYDPIKSSKMDDLVSRIINVSMDLYTSITFQSLSPRNERARSTEFRECVDTGRGAVSRILGTPAAIRRI